MAMNINALPSTPLERANIFLEILNANKTTGQEPAVTTGWDHSINEGLSVVSGSEPALKEGQSVRDILPTITFKLEITSEMVNGFGTCHGGCVATIIDDCTSWAPFAMKSIWEVPAEMAGKHFSLVGFQKVLKQRMHLNQSVTRTLNISYIRPLLVGSIYLIECEVISNTARFVHIRCTVKGEDGKICNLAIHDKAKTNIAKI
ncbi:hypothetical protein NADFUDRAFT_84494 [Nadsonia fulvescens var. elongata DSM 6958]|uniref:Thioesterase domain-containing protein n=1 Tax=Nadsonia fulvescens var. elongata DSM 6958 TaxID=857566 RepID=A0A1E3PD42_9ASCO|nr:hypothetical protein NADFUDRAFT_84494 [Nadsonia fulvescens var. elongata DSM 6958]